MSLATRRTRAARLERWAEAAMRELLRGRTVGAVVEAHNHIAAAAWTMALAMEDERTRLMASLRSVDVEEP